MINIVNLWFKQIYNIHLLYKKPSSSKNYNKSSFPITSGEESNFKTTEYWYIVNLNIA